MGKYFISFDLETTGLDKSKDQIIQIAANKYDYETFEIVEQLNMYIQPMSNYTIGLGAYFKHNIKPEFLQDKPYLKDVAQKVIDFFGDNDIDIVTFNGNRFDIPFLKNELNKYGFDIDFTKRRCFDCFKEETRRNGNNLEDTFKRYTGFTFEECGYSAHDAFSDIKGTTEIFKRQFNTGYKTPESMYGEDGVFEDKEFRGEIKPCFTLGKYRQLSIDFVAEIDQNYLKWCLSDKCSFQSSTKEFIKKFVK
jgi:DNA polymerase III epsilon subunit-like protein